MLILFLQILPRRYYLQIPRNVEAAYAFALKRDNVVNMVHNSNYIRKTLGLPIYS